MFSLVTNLIILVNFSLKSNLGKLLKIFNFLFTLIILFTLNIYIYIYIYIYSFIIKIFMSALFDP